MDPISMQAHYWEEACNLDSDQRWGFGISGDDQNPRRTSCSGSISFVPWWWQQKGKCSISFVSWVDCSHFHFTHDAFDSDMVHAGFDEFLAAAKPASESTNTKFILTNSDSQTAISGSEAIVSGSETAVLDSKATVSGFGNDRFRFRSDRFRFRNNSFGVWNTCLGFRNDHFDIWKMNFRIENTVVDSKWIRKWTNIKFRNKDLWHAKEAVIFSRFGRETGDELFKMAFS